ncbi:MAG: MBL fold metallo-hydrolase [Gemmatimonadales bacterium]
MKLCLLGSGSSGNSVLLQSGQTRILIDAGFGPRTMARRMARVSVDPRSIEAVVVTHEHIDHARGVASGARKWGWTIHATAGTKGAWLPLSESEANVMTVGKSFAIGDIDITAVHTSHDATEPVAIIATGRESGVRTAIVYDLGVMTNSVRAALERVDILVIESNHDPVMLRNGPYPESLKRRIASREGHLSNRAAGIAAAECAHRGLSHVVLAHLSETNNTPQAATESMQNALRKTPFRGMIVTAPQNRPSRAVSVDKAAAFGPAQLSLEL